MLRESEKRFQVFSELEAELAVSRSPLTVRASDAQLERIDLQRDAELKDNSGSVGLDTFYQYLLPGYPRLAALAAELLCMLGTTQASILSHEH